MNFRLPVSLAEFKGVIGNQNPILSCDLAEKTPVLRLMQTIIVDMSCFVAARVGY